MDTTGARAVLLDLEGTLYAMGAPIPGAQSTIAAIRDSGLGLRFMTNIDSRPPAAIADELAGIGLEVPATEIFSPLSAARTLFASLETPRVLALVSVELSASLPVDCAGRRPTHVLVGDCREILDYGLLDRAFRAIRDGAELLALQTGRYFIREDGDHIDTGAVVAALEYASGQHARVLGKPAADFFELAARSAGVAVADCLVVGDDAGTDIAGGAAGGARTVQVRTGKYAGQTREGVVSRADAILDSISDLPRLLGIDSR